MTLNAKQLLDLCLRSIERAGWNAIVLSEAKPFQVQVFKEGEIGQILSIYIWNCTHGGGAARAADEFRIQLTGAVPAMKSGLTTLLLGWHQGYEVFVAWDIRSHEGQSSNSPSAQVRESVLVEANKKQFAVGQRGNGETVVAFQPQHFVTYALRAELLHDSVSDEDSAKKLDNLAEVNDEQIEGVASPERRKMLREVSTWYRASDFRERVLSAYRYSCAMCRTQLDLIDAAHVLPVAVAGSTDETSNGVALCKNHHAAYDRGLVSFDDDYRIEVSLRRMEELATTDRAGGSGAFTDSLLPTLYLPVDPRDHPNVNWVKLSREVRRWRG